MGKDGDDVWFSPKPGSSAGPVCGAVSQGFEDHGLQKSPPEERLVRRERWVFVEQVVGPFCTAVRSEVEVNFGCQQAELRLAVE